MTGLEIRFPGCQINGRFPDAGIVPGLYVVKDGWTGWDGGVPGRREAIARPGEHGEFDLPVLRGARTISLNGVAVARDAHTLDRLCEQVAGVGADGSRFVMTVRSRGSERWARARTITSDCVDAGVRSGWLRARFTIELVCADPRRFGTLREVSGASVQVSQRGNFPAAPTVLVEGPVDAPYTVSGPGGRAFQVTQSLTASQSHVIDFRHGRVSRNGTPQSGVIGRADTWSIPPGRQVPMSIDRGAMTVQVADTYI